MKKSSPYHELVGGKNKNKKIKYSYHIDYVRTYLSSDFLSAVLLMGRPPWFSKPTSVLLIRTKVLVLVGVVCWLLLVSGHVVVGSEFEERRALATLSMSSLRPIEPLERMEDEIGTGKPSTFFTRPATDLNYMSNRKVPNGPDPIHNRRTGNSKQPPRQSQAARP